MYDDTTLPYMEDDGVRIRKVHHKRHRQVLERALGLRTLFRIVLEYRTCEGGWRTFECATPALFALLGFHGSVDPDDDHEVLRFNATVGDLDASNDLRAVRRSAIAYAAVAALDRVCAEGEHEHQVRSLELADKRVELLAVRQGSGGDPVDQLHPADLLHPTDLLHPADQLHPADASCTAEQGLSEASE